MAVVLLSSQKELAVAGQDVVRLFFPDDKIIFRPADDFRVLLNVSGARQGKKLTAEAALIAKDISLLEKASNDIVPEDGGDDNRIRRLVRLAIFRALCRYTGSSPSPWGILTGIRPTKIVHRLMDMSWERDKITDYLMQGYEMAPEKANLLADIAQGQRRFLLTKEQAERLVSIYIGIPFCPTRCAYCSFPSYSIKSSGNLVEPFLASLQREITGVGTALNKLGIKVQTIYIGGGTPTVVDISQLKSLLKHICCFLVSDETVEVTLEAGRPDTLSQEKLEAALDHGITRLSVNPQSMNPGTLDLIGRRHTPEETVGAVEMARLMGFKNINMDMIIGLPGETLEDIEFTLSEISKIRPENLTVHTLAVKRASPIKEARENYNLPPAEEVERMLEITAEAARKMGMHPYYLYRQKKMVGHLENIGYARKGFECIYNIQIIEERQSVIGLGGGAGSKFVEPGTWYLTSQYNPKDPETYIRRVDELIDRKVDKLATFGYNKLVN